MELVSTKAKTLWALVPKAVYGGSDGNPGIVFGAVLEAQGTELDEVLEAIDGALDQFFVRNADDYGLDRWEDELALPRIPSLTIVERQDRIVSRLRGFGTATLELVEAVANSYQNGEVDVDDLTTDPTLADYTVRVTFVSETGIPTNLADLQAAIDSVVPAHLVVEYVFNYLTMGDMTDLGFTLGQWSGTVAGGPAGAPLTLEEFSEYA